MDKRKKIEEILLTDYGCFDDFTVDKLCDLFSVVGRSEQYCDWCSSTEEVEVKICKKCRQGMDNHR